MSRVAKRNTFTMLGSILLVALIYLALPVHAGVETASTPDVLCSKSTHDGVILTACDESGWFAGLVDTNQFMGVQSNFRDPIY